MALALVQVGLLVKDQLVLDGSSRAGAREAAVTTDDGRARQAAMDAASAGGLATDGLTVTISRQGGTGSPVEVTVAYHEPIIVPLVDWLFPSAVDMSAVATMRQEGG
jgi:hypothetical protein